MTIFIPKKFLEEFVSVAENNLDSHGLQVETLAILTGVKSGSDILAKELIFPSQHGTASFVEDFGELNLF